MAHVPKSESPAVAAAAGVKASPARPSGVPDDPELVRRAQAEDKEAFEELVRRHQHRVFAVAGGILRRREDVEDIAQQVFVKAYFSLRKKKVRPLIYESDLSEEQARQFDGSEKHENLGPDTSETLEMRQHVDRLLAGIDERDRMMLILKEVEGFAVEEIAQMLDLNANTVKVRLFRARRRIVSQARERGSH